MRKGGRREKMIASRENPMRGVPSDVALSREREVD